MSGRGMGRGGREGQSPRKHTSKVAGNDTPRSAVLDPGSRLNACTLWLVLQRLGTQLPRDVFDSNIAEPCRDPELKRTARLLCGPLYFGASPTSTIRPGVTAADLRAAVRAFETRHPELRVPAELESLWTVCNGFHTKPDLEHSDDGVEDAHGVRFELFGVDALGLYSDHVAFILEWCARDNLAGETFEDFGPEALLRIGTVITNSYSEGWGPLLYMVCDVRSAYFGMVFGWGGYYVRGFEGAILARTLTEFLDRVAENLDSSKFGVSQETSCAILEDDEDDEELWSSFQDSIALYGSNYPCKYKD
eukprot:m.87956 g.87956  ORF g.87956 m.87956 type:complete len:306 (+) comp11598_c0_seq3:1369-2286(+)